MYIEIDERTDVLASLAMFLKCVRDLDKEPGLWKWAIISMHNALQGAMVCHLSGTAQMGAMGEKSVGEWFDWRERDLRGEIKRIDDGIDEFGVPAYRFASKADYPPELKLATTTELFKRLYTENKRIEPGAGAVLHVSERQRWSFKNLDFHRNGLAHFAPAGWSIEVSGLPAIFADIIDILGEIAKDSWSFRHMSEDERARLLLMLGEARNINYDI